MFEPKSKMTPQAEADFLIQEIRDTRTAYDNATVDKWRAQHLGMIGLRMSALVRAARKVLAAAHPATQSDTDADQCTMASPQGLFARQRFLGHKRNMGYATRFNRAIGSLSGWNSPAGSRLACSQR
jgi:hypothetical protein